MQGRTASSFTTLLCGLVYWFAVNLLEGTGEPWDGPHYWALFYPMALGLAALSGFVFHRLSWRAGAIIMVSQLPAMLAGSSFDPLIGLGLMLLLMLATPAALAAWGAASLRKRFWGSPR